MRLQSSLADIYPRNIGVLGCLSSSHPFLSAKTSSLKHDIFPIGTEPPFAALELLSISGAACWYILLIHSLRKLIFTSFTATPSSHHQHFHSYSPLAPFSSKSSCAYECWLEHFHINTPSRSSFSSVSLPFLHFPAIPINMLQRLLNRLLPRKRPVPVCGRSRSRMRR